MNILKVGPSSLGELGRLFYLLAVGLFLASALRFANGYDWTIGAIGAVLALISGVLAKRHQQSGPWAREDTDEES